MVSLSIYRIFHFLAKFLSQSSLIGCCCRLSFVFPSIKCSINISFVVVGAYHFSVGCFFFSLTHSSSLPLPHVMM